MSSGESAAFATDVRTSRTCVSLYDFHAARRIDTQHIDITPFWRHGWAALTRHSQRMWVLPDVFGLFSRHVASGALLVKMVSEASRGYLD
jgi:hypothetical protein